MKEFATLLEQLALIPSRNRKIEVLSRYFADTPDPDRGLALAVLTDNLSFKHIKSAVLKDIVTKHSDPHLFRLSYDYVGDLAETIALIWPYARTGDHMPRISTIIEAMDSVAKIDVPKLVENLLNQGDPNERWALIKLATGNLRIGVSARLAKTALAAYGKVELQEIEEIWHGLKPPYTEFFAWLDGHGDKPDIAHTETFHPLMLSTPIDEEKDFETLNPAEFTAEWKWDGIRVQLALGVENQALYSRTGDDISAAFPDILDHVRGVAVLDGELLVGHDYDPQSFNHLQQRLNRKSAVANHLIESPAFIKIYDILYDGEEDIRSLPLDARRERLVAWFEKNPQTRLSLSDQLPFISWDDLALLRRQGADDYGHEGVMIKRRTSPYVPGRPKGLWFKWKRDSNTVDAILMYAQRGHGKRSSFYSDYTFGVWKGNEIVPIGKAYSGFTDEELKKLDKFVRTNTLSRYGPVREVKKELVFEVAFDSAHVSKRHKSGIALRFPRIHRIRWDKPAQEAATLDDMQAFL